MNAPNGNGGNTSGDGGFRRRRRRRGRGNGAPGNGGTGSATDSYDDDQDQGYDGDDQDDGGSQAASAASAAPVSSASPEVSLAVPDDKTVIVGITGEPGAGKSALAKELVKLGATLIDADDIGHDVIEATMVKKKLVKEFGEDILDENGAISRRLLGAKAFADEDSTAKLNAIVHPKLTTAIKAALKKAGNFVVIDAALLHELGFGESCTAMIYVRAPRDARIARVAERGWDEAELTRREVALGDADARRRKCGLTVDNSGEVSLLTAYAKHILARQLGIDPASLRRDPPPQRQAAAAGDAAQNRAPQPSREPREGSQSREPRDGQRDPVSARDNSSPRDPVSPRDNSSPRDNASPRDHQAQRPVQAPPPPEREPIKIELDHYLRQTLPQLQAEAEKLTIPDLKWLKKHDLICEILRRIAGGRQDEILINGYMEMVKDQHAYVRSPINGYLAVATDAFVQNQQIRRFGLKPGMQVTGSARAPRGAERCLQLLTIATVMGEPENQRTPVQDFEHLVPLHANERLFMELPADPTDYSLRIIDLVSPIGKGQRGLIVAQPKCGKTVYLQKIAKAITTNNPEVELIVLLVDERPEEVTDMQRSVRGEVVASTFDQPASRHVQCAEMVINKAKRLVERGRDVVILLDSITRLARAYNTEAPSSGRIMSGGIEAGALIKPKQFFGAARKIEDGGSLTILATALVDTGSLMDTVIFEEFKGTGNMELVLDRRLANRRIFPAVDCAASGTRKDDLLIKNEDELRCTWALRKFLADRSSGDAVDFLKSKLKNYKTNVEFLLSIDPEKMSGW